MWWWWLCDMTLTLKIHKKTGTQHINGEFDRNMDTQVTFQVALKPLNRSQNHLEVKITAETKRENSDNLLVQSEMTLCVHACVRACVCVPLTLALSFTRFPSGHSTNITHTLTFSLWHSQCEQTEYWMDLTNPIQCTYFQSRNAALSLKVKYIISVPLVKQNNI